MIAFSNRDSFMAVHEYVGTFLSQKRRIRKKKFFDVCRREKATIELRLTRSLIVIGTINWVYSYHYRTAALTRVVEQMCTRRINSISMFVYIYI